MPINKLLVGAFVGSLELDGYGLAKLERDAAADAMVAADADRGDKSSAGSPPRPRDPYDRGFASHWDELVGWKERAAADKGFLLSLLRKYDCRRILDVALGTGFHSINLMSEGFDVKALDISQSMIEVAKTNAAKRSVELDAIQCDWVEMNAVVRERFDCVLCLGNSLACENDGDRRRVAVKNWSAALNDGGVVIVDRRNYEAMLAGEYNSRSKGQYFGDTVRIGFKKVSEEGTEFSYTFADGQTFDLRMFPVLDGEIRSICGDAGLEAVEVYGDRQLAHEGSDVGFYSYVFRKI